MSEEVKGIFYGDALPISTKEIGIKRAGMETDYTCQHLHTVG